MKLEEKDLEFCIKKSYAISTYDVCKHCEGYDYNCKKYISLKEHIQTIKQLNNDNYRIR